VHGRIDAVAVEIRRRLHRCRNLTGAVFRFRCFAEGLIYAAATAGASALVQETEVRPMVQIEPTQKGYDPVCQMEVPFQTAPARSDYDGLTYFFCSTQCKRTFDSDPDGALDRMAARRTVSSPMRIGNPSVTPEPGAFMRSRYSVQ
jgi:Cu+-exporting ATPase